MILFLNLLRFIIIGILIYLLFKLFRKSEFFGHSKKDKKTKTPKALEEMKKDPVCGTFIPESQAILYIWKKETYYFCSEECKKKFQKQL